MVRKRLFRACVILLSLAALLLLAPATTLYAAPLRGDEVVVGDDLTLRKGEHIDGDLVMMGGNLTMQAGSRVEGSVTVLGGRVEIDGAIEGELIALGGDVALDTHARVKGEVVAIGGRVSQAEGARAGKIVEGLEIRPVGKLRIPLFLPGTGLRSWSAVWNTVAALASAVILALLGMAVVTFWPTQTTQVGKTIISAPLPSLGVGCLLYPLAGSLTLVLLVTICLSPLAPVVALLLVTASLFGWIGLGTLWGRWLVRWLNWHRLTPALTVGVGVFSLTIGAAFAGAIPCMGPMLVLGMTSISLGAVALSRFGSSRYRRYGKS